MLGIVWFLTGCATFSAPPKQTSCDMPPIVQQIPSAKLSYQMQNFLQTAHPIVPNSKQQLKLRNTKK